MPYPDDFNRAAFDRRARYPSRQEELAERAAEAGRRAFNEAETLADELDRWEDEFPADETTIAILNRAADLLAVTRELVRAQLGPKRGAPPASPV